MDVELFCGDSLVVLDELIKRGTKIEGVLTSPPYNISRKNGDMYSVKYNSYQDTLSNTEYIRIQTSIVEKLEKILIKNGCLLYNINYGCENTDAMWLLLANIIENTDLTVVEQIIWKKRNAIPNNVSKNRLTRIVENVFVICRKSEVNTFNANKPIVSAMKGTGQDVYANVYNFIVAPNNNRGSHTKVHKATYSTELCERLIKMYFQEKDTIIDPFMGTGTTGLACLNTNRNFIGIEMDEKYYCISKDRIDELKRAPIQNVFDFEFGSYNLIDSENIVSQLKTKRKVADTHVQIQLNMPFNKDETK
jgi:DNA modification methylase